MSEGAGQQRPMISFTHSAPIQAPDCTTRHLAILWKLKKKFLTDYMSLKTNQSVITQTSKITVSEVQRKFVSKIAPITASLQQYLFWMNCNRLADPIQFTVSAQKAPQQSVLTNCQVQ